MRKSEECNVKVLERTGKKREKKMQRQRRISLAAAFVLAAALVLAACGSQEGQTETTSGSENQIHGKVVDAGEISALCPDGWTSVGLPDLEAEDGREMRKDGLRFVKGTGSDTDNSAFIELIIYRSENEIPETDPSKWYDNVNNTGNIVTGDYTWNGFSALSLGEPMVYLKTAANDCAFTATLYTQEGNPLAASVQDSDVQAILSSVKASSK